MGEEAILHFLHRCHGTPLGGQGASHGSPIGIPAGAHQPERASQPISQPARRVTVSTCALKFAF
jgi:hypothetical protein